MKKLFLVALAVTSMGLTAEAKLNEAGDLGTLVCDQNTLYSPDVSQGRASVVLKQVGSYDYALTFSRKQPYAERKVLLQTVVRVFQQDVVVRFRNITDRVSFHLYLDEMDSSTLSYGGADVHFTCESLNEVL